jgi:hypothetical protein
MTCHHQPSRDRGRISPIEPYPRGLCQAVVLMFPPKDGAPWITSLFGDFELAGLERCDEGRAGGQSATVKRSLDSRQVNRPGFHRDSGVS